MVEFYSAVNTIEFGQEYFKYFTLIHSWILSAQSQYYFGINDFERFVFSIDSMQKNFRTCSKSIILGYLLFFFADLILSTLGLFYLLFTFYNFGGVFGAQLNVGVVFFCFFFFAEIVNDLKLSIVFANGLSFDV